MKRIFFLTTVCLLAVFAQAQVKLAQVKTVRSAFRQTRIEAMLSAPQVLTGHFAYDAPSKVEWTYDDGVSMQLPEQMLAFIGQAVSGKLAVDNEMFDVEWQSNTLILTPKKKTVKKIFSSIHIVFTAGGVAQTVVLNEPSGDQTVIEFINMKYA